ncbi:MAG: hypothetical protein EXR05_10490 [Acetobacteraceae bacterium]|nr:hypothetical protein [Acetobacteraceae bacterium]
MAGSPASASDAAAGAGPVVGMGGRRGLMGALLPALLILPMVLALRAPQRDVEGMVERAVLDVSPVLLLLAAGYDFPQRELLMVVGALP